MMYGSTSNGGLGNTVGERLLPVASVDSATAVEMEDTVPGHNQHKNNLGVVNGVFVPCLLNILGVILFLRLGFAVGHAGWMGVLGMFVVGETLALLTVFSMAAIVSNGTMKGGGSYYLISRSLGAEFGGSIGLLFYLAYSVGTSFYVVGFASEIVDAFIAEPDMSESEKRKYNVIIASAALAVVMGISYIGAGFFTKINGIVFAVQFGSIFVALLSMYFGSRIDTLENGGTFYGFSTDLLHKNTWGEYTKDEKCGGETCTFRSVFAIIFPAMTGIMEGANLSGDLKNPNRDIGRGTIAAVFGAIVTYACLVLGLAAGFDRPTLRNNMNVMVDVCWPSKYVVVVGIAVSSFSSALGSVFGGSRVLQALGRDDLPPGWGLTLFAKGSKVGDEPRRAVLATWVIAQCACLVGDLDIISPVIASFFLLSYGTVNLTCLLLDVSGTPNFRPHFQYYSRLQSFTGFALCIGTLFYLNVWYSVIALTCLLLLMVYISYKAPVKPWGDVSQSIMYHQVRKYLLRLDEKDHPKNWRPSLLLLLGPGKINMYVIEFCNSLKKGGLYSIGDAVIGNLETAGVDVESVRSNWVQLVKDLNIKAIPDVTFGPTIREAFQQICLLSGLGGMKPNSVVLLLPKVFAKPSSDVIAQQEQRRNLLLREDSTHPMTPEIPVFAKESEFVDVLRDVTISFKKNLLIACNFDRHVLSNKSCPYIDVWTFGNEPSLPGTLSLQFQLAHIMRLEGRGSKIRLFNIVDGYVEHEEQQEKLAKITEQARLHKTTIHVIASRNALPLDNLTANKEQLLADYNQIILSNSQANTKVSLLPLPYLPTSNEQEDSRYVKMVNKLVNDLPPVVLVMSNLTNVFAEEL